MAFPIECNTGIAFSLYLLCVKPRFSEHSLMTALPTVVPAILMIRHQRSLTLISAVMIFGKIHHKYIFFLLADSRELQCSGCVKKTGEQSSWAVLSLRLRCEFSPWERAAQGNGKYTSRTWMHWWRVLYACGCLESLHNDICRGMSMVSMGLPPEWRWATRDNSNSSCLPPWK